MIDVLIYTTEALIVVAVALTVWSVVHTLRIRGKGGKRVNRIPVKAIAYGVAAALLLMLVLTYLLTDVRPMLINGKPFADTFWIRMAGMFVTTSLLLMAIAAVAVVIGRFRYGYQKKKHA